MINDWEAIVGALCVRDGERAQQLLSDHIYFFNLMHARSE
jgi:hypothetical protein